MKRLAALIAELENYLPDIQKENKTISQGSVGWHVEHSLLSLIKMISVIEDSDPALYKRQFNIKRLFVLITGMIPRGSAKAPQSVLPGEEINPSTILPLMEKAKEKIIVFEQLD